MSNLIYHHTGLLVYSIEDSLTHYTKLFGEENISKTYTVNSQKVKVCFIKNGKDTYIELVEPSDENSVVSKMLKKRLGYYHIAYKVEKIQDSINMLEEMNYKSFEIFHSEAFKGKPCVFLYTPDGHLVELIEK